MKSVLVAVAALCVVGSVAAQESENLALTREHDYRHAIAREASPQACPGTTVTPPYSATNSITGFECRDVLGHPEVVYSFHGRVGDVVRIDVASSAFELFLYMYLGNGTSAQTSDASYLTSGVSRRRISYTIAAEKNYDIEISPLFSGSTSQPTTGSFAFSITSASASGGSSCSPQAMDSLFFQSRFKITLTARDQRTGNTGPGVAFKQNDSYGLFAVPALTGNTTDPTVFVKLLDGRPVNGKFWIFYAGLTEVEYTITAVDTILGIVKTYHNPPGSTQGGFDTDAFTP